MSGSRHRQRRTADGWKFTERVYEARPTPLADVEQAWPTPPTRRSGS
jgi:hypothetical protein